MHVIAEWKVSLYNCQHVGVVLMDLSKAFDAIPHGLLLTKLYTYGISKDVCNVTRVKLDDVRSSWKCIVRVVPHGSQSGPHIFNIFQNDLFYFLEGLCQTTNYADNNSLASKIGYLQILYTFKF